MRTALPIAVFLVAGTALWMATAELRWSAATRRLVERLHAGKRGVPPRVSMRELEGLPAPVVRYLAMVLREGQPFVTRARLELRGEFLVKPPDVWRPFTSVEHLDAATGGFVWNARIRVGPLLAVRVRDALAGGAGSTHASLAALVPLVRVEGTPDVTAGALHRYLAEGAWLPTALLPSAGVSWSPIDAASARVSATAGGATVSLDVRFGPEGVIESVFTPVRLRDVKGRAVPTPWRGHFSEYAELDGMLVPLAGEVEWVLPEGPQPYWRGRVAAATYD